MVKRRRAVFSLGAGAANGALIDAARGRKDPIESWQLDETRQWICVRSLMPCVASLESHIGTTSPRPGAAVDGLTLASSHVGPGAQRKVLTAVWMCRCCCSVIPNHFKHFRKLMTKSWNADRCSSYYIHSTWVETGVNTQLLMVWLHREMIV